MKANMKSERLPPPPPHSTPSHPHTILKHGENSTISTHERFCILLFCEHQTSETKISKARCRQTENVCHRAHTNHKGRTLIHLNFFVSTKPCDQMSVSGMHPLMQNSPTAMTGETRHLRTLNTRCRCLRRRQREQINLFMLSGLFYLKSLDMSISNRRGV